MNLEPDSSGDDISGLIEYPNVPGSIGAVISCGKASLIECQTVLSIEDVYLLLEIANVDARNQVTLSKRTSKD